MEKIKNFLKKFIKKDNKAITIILVLAIFSVVNFLSTNIFLRFDITQNKDYSISNVSKKTAKNIDDIINIKAYFSGNLPPKYLNLQQEIKDILDEYESYSKGKINIEYIDPTTDEIKAELKKKGIPALRFNVMKNDAFEVVQGYIGLSFEYADKQEIIPMISNTANLEYNVTLAIKKIIADSVPVLGIVSSNGVVKKEEMGFALRKLQELYEIKFIDLKADDKISDSVKTLMIVGPKEKFGEEELKKIDEFVISGRPLVLLADGINVERGMKVSKNNTDVNKILENYGLKINNDLILDTSSGRASFSQGFLTFMVDYPLWPKVISDNFNQNNVMVANLSSLMLPWVSSIEKTKEIDGLNTIYLARSTRNGWAQKDNFKLNPQEISKTKGENGQYNFAIFAQGKLKSAFSDKEIDNARLIVVSDSDFTTDVFLKQNPDNLIFFQNLVDGLSLDEDLITIRSGGISEKPLKPVSKEKKSLLRYLNIFGMTILVLGFGLLRYFLRRKSKAIDSI